MNERDEMRALAEAHGCGVEYIPVREKDGIYKRVYEPVRPVPCVRDDGGEIKMQSIKALFAKIDEELNELKEAIIGGEYADLRLWSVVEGESRILFPQEKERIAEEAADTITAITTLCHALGIDAKMRNEAQRRVNRRNMERGRL